MGTRTRHATRVLPAIVLLLIAVLPMRVGLVWESTAQLANAEEATPAAPAHDTGAPAANGPEIPAAGAETPAAAGEPAAHATAAADATAAPSAEPFDPQTLTKADYEVLQQLAKRRAELDQREKDLADRAAMLEAVQQQVSAKVDQQQKLKSDLEKLSAAQQEAGDAKYRRLVKIYEAMKPDEAARILEKMEGAVLLEVVMRMGERRLAPVLAQMDPIRAQAITVAMAARLEASPEVAALPEPQLDPAAPVSQPVSQ